MQSRGIFLSLLLGVLVFSISGFLPSAFAEQILLNENSCENEILDASGETLLDLQGIWLIDTCTVNGFVEIGFGQDPDAEDDEPVLDEVSLFIPGTITLEITETAEIYLLGFIVNSGHIENSGYIESFEESGISNENEFNNSGNIEMAGEFQGIGNISNSGDIVFYGQFDVSGSITNSGQITSDQDFRSDSMFTNTGVFQTDGSSGFRNVENFGEFINNGSLDIAGFQSSIGVFRNNIGSTFTNSGFMTIDPSGEIDNIEGFVSVPGSNLELAGKFTNHDLFENNLSNFNIVHSGIVINLGDFINDGIMQFSSNHVGFATLDGTQDTTTSFVNNSILIDQCGKIFGPYVDNGIYTDQCDAIVTIDFPLNDASFTDQDIITFEGTAVDVFLNGTIVDYTDYLEWKNGGDVLGSGSPVSAQFFSPPPVYNIKANAFDDLGNPILDTSGDQIHAKVKINIGIVDNDGDTFAPLSSGGEDCDDTNPTINPDATEIIGDGIDQNCDGVDTPATDADGDGFFLDYGTQLDCNDGDATVFPGAPEIVGDGIDQDCDGFDTAPTDADGDSFFADFGEVDCDDTNPTINPDATEIIGDGIDQNCDGVDTPATDADGDGFFLDYGTQLDCNDGDATVFPGAPEIVGDGIDQDCDGFDTAPTDADGDGFLVSDGDCNDGDATVFPGAPELVDGQDNSCDGNISEFETDADFDGWVPGDENGEIDVGGWDAEPVPLGGGDCNDVFGEGENINPLAEEVPNGIDDNCDGEIPLNEFDNDNDGSTADLDCNESDDSIYPGATEIVDGKINDCNTTILPSNEVDDDLDGYIDGIFDTSGWDGTPIDMGENDCIDNLDPISGTELTGFDVNPGAIEETDGIDNNCDGVLLLKEIDNDGDGQAEYQGDCDDISNLAEFVFLGNTETDDGIDNNCDGVIDEGFDLDGDTFTPDHGGDCDDTNPLTYPGALEIPDGEDNDCDGIEDFPMSNKFTTPEHQQNLDDKTIRDYEKQAEKLEDEIEDLQRENGKLDRKAEKYEAKAESSLLGNQEKADKYQEKSDKYQDKANDATEDGNDKKADKYQEKSDKYQDKADKALLGDQEKADKYQEKADKLRAEIPSNESLIEIYEEQIFVIDVSLGKIPIDWNQAIIVEYPLLTEDAKHDILHEIEDNLKEMEKLEEKAVKYDEKADKEEVKGKLDKAAKYRLKAIEAREEIEIIEDLNTVLECAIDFTPDMLADHGYHGHHSNGDDKGKGSDKYYWYGDD